MYVLLCDVFNGCPSSIKEISRLVSKWIRVLLFDIFNGCSLVYLKKEIGW